MTKNEAMQAAEVADELFEVQRSMELLGNLVSWMDPKQAVPADQVQPLGEAILEQAARLEAARRALGAI